ncbi:MAG TPA: hypothetical protein VF916_10170 [Ktedonobacterales bacterium]|jgi:ABC-2 type transport system permease protein
MTQQLPALVGALRYEFRMQVRRPTVWITFAIFTVLLVVLVNQGPVITVRGYFATLLAHESLSKAVADWCFNIASYLPICVGCLLAGRLVRDRRTKVDELFTALPTPLRTRLFGKYLGALLATALPMFLVYMLGIVYLAALAHNPLAILLALETFVVLALPGVMFVSAFSIAVPVLLWVPLYQFLFIGYWFWTTLWFHAELPNLARTLLSPISLYIAMGIYGLNESDSGPNHPIHITGTPAQGILSAALLLGVAAVVLVMCDRYLTWRQARQ